jgi:hypothetical protein
MRVPRIYRRLFARTEEDHHSAMAGLDAKDREIDVLLRNADVLVSEFRDSLGRASAVLRSAGEDSGDGGKRTAGTERGPGAP